MRIRINLNLPKQYHPQINIPEYFEIDEKLAWAIGFYLAEGTKSKDTVAISNCELIPLLKFKQILEFNFSIPHTKWYIYIHAKEEDNDLGNYISKLFNIKKVRFVKGRLANKANIDLRINNRVLASVFNSIINRSAELILNNENLSLEFIKGYVLGDGSVIQRNGYLYGVSITVQNELYKDILEKAILKKYNIKPRIRFTKNCYELNLTGIHLMTNLILDEYFRTVNRQWQKLIKCYLKNSMFVHISDIGKLLEINSYQ